MWLGVGPAGSLLFCLGERCRLAVGAQPHHRQCIDSTLVNGTRLSDGDGGRHDVRRGSEVLDKGRGRRRRAICVVATVLARGVWIRAAAAGRYRHRYHPAGQAESCDSEHRCEARWARAGGRLGEAGSREPGPSSNRVRSAGIRREGQGPARRPGFLHATPGRMPSPATIQVSWWR